MNILNSGVLYDWIKKSSSSKFNWLKMDMGGDTVMSSAAIYADPDDVNLVPRMFCGLFFFFFLTAPPCLVEDTRGGNFVLIDTKRFSNILEY